MPLERLNLVPVCSRHSHGISTFSASKFDFLLETKVHSRTAIAVDGSIIDRRNVLAEIPDAFKLSSM